MTEEGNDSTPRTGYSLVEVYANERTLQHAPPEDEDAPEESSIGIIWDWRVPEIEAVADASSDAEGFPTFVFEIALGVEMAPSRERPELIRTILVGRFQYDEGEKSVPLDQFVELHGVATLYPYLREAVSDLTDLSFRDAVYLPIVDINGLMADFEAELTTGWNQLSRHPKLAEALGFDIPIREGEPDAAKETPEN